MFEDDRPERPLAAREVLGQDLSRRSVEDLREYRTALEGEIARVERELANREDVRAAAEALFKKPAG